MSFSPWYFGITSWEEVSQVNFGRLEEVTHGVTFAEGVNVQEGEDFVAFEELEGGDVSWEMDC